MKIIGCVNGYNSEDKRCNECVDFVNTGRAIYEGEDFSCTYCGDQWKDGLTSQERYERKHNVKHCDNCLSYAAPFDGDKCADCVAESAPVVEPVMTPNRQSAVKSGRKAKMHATDVNQTRTVCGNATDGMFKGGYHEGETEVTCGNCVRILRKTPMVEIEIETYEYSTDALDHSECDHDDTESDECESVGGLSLEGDQITLDCHTERFTWDAVDYAECVDLTEYIEKLMHNAGDARWADYNERGQGHTCHEYIGGQHTDYTVTVYGPGVTDAVRSEIFRALQNL